MKGLQRRVGAEEEARRKLAREIHDDFGQRVAALGFELLSICRQVDGARRSQLDQVGQRLGDLGEDLHRLSHDLHPAVLERRGLLAALRDTCAEIRRREGLPLEMDLHGPEPAIPAEVALGIYRIAQEGLTNAARHADAQSAHLSLCVGNHSIHLRLIDDGKGFDPEAVRRSGGLGLAGMEERARLLGGRCRIVSSPGKGTTLELDVPRRRLGRWIRRRWRWLAAVTLIVLALGGGLAATLVQAQQTAAEARRAEAAVEFLEGLFAASDPRRAHGEIPDARELLQRGTEQLARELADQPLLRAKLLDTLGGIHTELGLYDEARSLLEEALSLRQRLRAPGHPEIAATLVRLGALAHYSGEGDAVAIFRRVLAMQEQRGTESSELADVLNKLGAALGAQGRFDEAEAVLQRSLQVHERVFGGKDPRVAKVLHNLSGIALNRKDFEATETLIRRALEIREANLDEDDLELAGSREALAILYRSQGRMAESAVLLERIAASAERVFGPEHPQLARTLLNLGLVRYDLGEKETARQLLERALAINEATLASTHPQHIRALDTLAKHHFQESRFPEAEILYRRLLELHSSGAAYSGWEAVLAEWDQLQQEIR